MNRPLNLPVAFALLVGCGILAPHTALGASWALVSCTNVAAGDRGLWFDSPGPGADNNNNEGGFFWFVNDGSHDEKCTYQTVQGGPNHIATTDFPTLRVRVAVNDGARFTVALLGSAVEFCREPVASLTTGRTHDNSEFRTYEIALPAGHHVCAVSITLDDDPNDSDGQDSGRVKALIDYIHITNNVTVGWGESFAAGNP